MNAIILAAGKGTRMKNSQPKVLIDIEGVPLLKRIVDNIDTKEINKTIVVVGENGELIQNTLKDKVTYAYQMIPIGTLDAISTAKEGPDITATFLVLIYLSKTSFIKRHVSCSIPLVAIQMCCSFFI